MNLQFLGQIKVPAQSTTPPPTSTSKSSSTFARGYSVNTTEPQLDNHFASDSTLPPSVNPLSSPHPPNFPSTSLPNSSPNLTYLNYLSEDYTPTNDCLISLLPITLSFEAMNALSDFQINSYPNPLSSTKRSQINFSSDIVADCSSLSKNLLHPTQEINQDTPKNSLQQLSTQLDCIQNPSFSNDLSNSDMDISSEPVSDSTINDDPTYIAQLNSIDSRKEFEKSYHSTNTKDFLSINSDLSSDLDFLDGSDQSLLNLDLLLSNDTPIISPENNKNSTTSFSNRLNQVDITSLSSLETSGDKASNTRNDNTNSSFQTPSPPKDKISQPQTSETTGLSFVHFLQDLPFHNEQKLNNPDIDIILGTLTLLKQQLCKAITDLNKLSVLQNSALADPQNYISQVINRKGTHSSFQQSVAAIPPLNLEEYLNSASLESLENFLINTDKLCSENLESENNNGLKVFDDYFNITSDFAPPKRERKKRVDFSYKNYSSYFNERFTKSLPKPRFNLKAKQDSKKGLAIKASHHLSANRAGPKKLGCPPSSFSNKSFSQLPIKTHTFRQPSKVLSNITSSSKNSQDKDRVTESNTEARFPAIASNDLNTLGAGHSTAQMLFEDSEAKKSNLDFNLADIKAKSVKSTAFKTNNTSLARKSTISGDSDFFSDISFQSPLQNSFQLDSLDSQSDQELFVIPEKGNDKNSSSKLKPRPRPRPQPKKVSSPRLKIPFISTFKKKYKVSASKNSTPGYEPPPPSIYNKPWTDQEQKQLEKLLVIHPDEPIANNRWRKISNALGTRTMRQVASRVQKYFIKLNKAGKPIPGRLPDFTKWSSLKKEHKNAKRASDSALKRRERYLSDESYSSSQEDAFTPTSYSYSTPKPKPGFSSNYKSRDDPKSQLESKPCSGRKRGRKPKNPSNYNMSELGCDLDQFDGCPGTKNIKPILLEKEAYTASLLGSKHVFIEKPDSNSKKKRIGPEPPSKALIPIFKRAKTDNITNDGTLGPNNDTDEEIDVDIDIEVDSSDSEKPLFNLVLGSAQKAQPKLKSQTSNSLNEPHPGPNHQILETHEFQNGSFSGTRNAKKSVKKKSQVKTSLDLNFVVPLAAANERKYELSLPNSNPAKQVPSGGIVINEPKPQNATSTGINALPSNINIRKSVLHVGYRCDGCFSEPIVGTRWHCIDCSKPGLKDEVGGFNKSGSAAPSSKKAQKLQRPTTDFDLCDECMTENFSVPSKGKKSNYIHNHKHKFIAVTTPDFEPDHESVLESAFDSIIDPINDPGTGNHYSFFDAEMSGSGLGASNGKNLETDINTLNSELDYLLDQDLMQSSVTSIFKDYEYLA